MKTITNSILFLLVNTFKMLTWDLSVLSWTINSNINNLSSDSVSLLLSVVSIIMSFILTTATYLLWIWVPQIRTQSLSSKIRKDNVMNDLNELLIEKKNISNCMIYIYLWTFILILTPVVLYIFWIAYTRRILFIPLSILSTIFVVLIVKINRITSLSLSIDEQLLAIEKSD